MAIHSTRARTAALALPLLASMSLSLAACGGGSADKAPSTPTASTAGAHSSNPSAPSGAASGEASASGASGASGNTESVIYTKPVVTGRFRSIISLGWQGGMIGAGKTDKSDPHVWGWTPGMTDVKSCELKVTESNETLATDPSYAATTGATPQVAVVYAVTTKASGLDAESTHVYAQPMDLESCHLGKRIDLLGAAVPEDMDADPKIVAEDADHVVVQPLDENTVLKGQAGVVGLDVNAQKVGWSTKFTDKRVAVRESYDGGPQAPGVFDLGVESDGSMDPEQRSLVSAKDGSTVTKEEDFEAPAARLDDSTIIYTNTKNSPNTQTILYGGKKTEVKGGAMARSARPMDDGHGATVLAGLYCPTGQNCSIVDTADGALGYVGKDGTIKQILSSEKVKSLHLKVDGVSNGRIYASTTDEHIVIGLDGKQIGSAYKTDDYPYSAWGERRIGDHLWTFWGQEVNISTQPVGEAGYVITRDASEQPKTPDER